MLSEHPASAQDSSQDTALPGSKCQPEALLPGHVSPLGWTEELQELQADFIMSLPLLSAELKCCWLNYPEIPQDLLLPRRSLAAQCCLQEQHYYSAMVSFAHWHDPGAGTLPSAVTWRFICSALPPPLYSRIAFPRTAAAALSTEGLWWWRGGRMGNATADSTWKTSHSIKRYHIVNSNYF